MTQEEKQLLLVDLCARLPYGVKVDYPLWRGCCLENEVCNGKKVKDMMNLKPEDIDFTSNREIPLPFLRPISSMTEEEYKIYHELIGGMFGTGILINLPILEDFLNKNHFDYRGLIKKNLALEAPDGMYNVKEK